jgi:8-oxo-dGTP diphosphatase
VAEETEIQVILGRKLRTVRYLSDGRPKQVDYWAARPAVPAPVGADEPAEPAPLPPNQEGDPAPLTSSDEAEPAPFTPNEEVDRLAWLPLTAAGDQLTYAHDTEVLSEFASAPAATTAIILVRHASARNKKAWQNAGHPDDLTRPLTPLGHVQAKLLGQILSCFGPARVISSPAERCLATAEPYAAMTGGVVEPALALAPPPDDLVLEDADPVAVAAARELVTGLVTAGEPVVICGHRENLPAVLRWICESLGAPVPAGAPLRKGAFRVLHVADGRLISAEQHSLKS